MASPKISFLPDRRQRASFIAIFFLIAIFVIGFYFFYVPANKQSLHRYAFSILENITVNMQERYNDTYRLIEGRMKAARNDKDPQWQELQKSMQLSVSDSVPAPAAAEFHFKINNGNRTKIVSVPPQQMLNALFASHREEIFESFLLLRMHQKNSEVLYTDPSLYIGSDVVADSLIKADRGALFSGIKDMQVRDLAYKMFFVPFNINGSKLVLCGFVKSSTYSAAAYQLPVGFIYVLVILLLLLLISLPLIRIYTIGKQETVRFYDLVAVVASLFIGCTVITVIIIQVALLKSGEINARNNVQKISEQIQTSFANEIQKAYRQLDSIDRYVADNKDSVQRLDSGLNASNILFQYIEEQNKDTGGYYAYDRISWVNKNGKQFMKAEPEKAEPVFQKVDDRKYFSAFKTNQYYSVPGMPGSSMALEGVYNWVNGKFRLILSKRSQVDTAFIVTMSLRSWSLMSTVLPAGYGFCIIDKAGNVQVHTNEYRNLNENLLNQVGSFNRVRGAMISRQETFFNEVDLYGRKHAFYIAPVAQMPFYLVTFYDKGYIVPVNMRILIFSLAFCALFYLVIGLCWLTIYYRRYYAKPMLAAPANIFSRAVPKEQNSRLYRRGALFLFAYLITLISMASVTTFANLDNNYLVLVIVLLTPINIILGLTVLIYAPLRYDASVARPGVRAKWGMAGLLFIFIITVLVTLFSSFAGGPQLMVFQGILTLGIFLYYRQRKGGDTRVEQPGPPFLYLVRYSAFWMLLIISLSVLPAALFTWYSHNQEILQSVKKQQLHLANALQSRKKDAADVVRVYDTAWLPAGFADSLLYKKGIYSTQTDSITLVGADRASLAGRKSYEEFYFEVASRISNTYYDPYSYPPLRDSSSDRSWYWRMTNDKQLGFTYAIPSDSSHAGTARFMQIFSTMPERYQVLRANFKGLVLALVVVLVLGGFYRLTRRLAERLFLRKFFITARPDSEAGFEKLVAGYAAISMANEKYIAALKKLPEEYKHALPAGKKEMYLYEQQLVAAISTYNSFYNFIWRRCSDRQKYILYQFARHGLMNGRNNADIYALLNKGILFIDTSEEEIRLLSRSFRAFILGGVPEEKLHALQQASKSESTWRSLRVPFLLVLLLAASFIFLTQHDTWQRMIALITGIGGVIPLLLNIFNVAGKVGPGSD